MLYSASCQRIPETDSQSLDIHAKLKTEDVIPELKSEFDNTVHANLCAENAGGTILSENSVPGLTNGADFHFTNVRYGAKPVCVTINGRSNLSCGLVSLTVPPIQNISSPHVLSPDAIAMAGAVSESDDCSILMMATSFLKFTIKHGGFTKLTFASVEGVDLAGKINIPLSSIQKNELSYYVSKGSKTIETSIPSNGTFYVAVLPEKKFTPILTFTDIDGKIACDTLPAPVTPAKASVIDLGEVDDDLQYKTAPAPEEMTEWEKQVKARADLIYNLSWTPSRQIPCAHKDEYFTAGQSVQGTPYSSVWGYSPAGFVGYTISFYTFLSALNNNNGMIYDIDYHYTPSGENTGKAGSMYGSVCSTTVMYILGYPYGYQTSQIVADYVPALIDLGKDFSDWKLFDAACYNDGDGGHTFMIYDIKKSADGAIESITVEEAWMPLTRRVTYTPPSLERRLQREGDGEYRHFRVDQKKFCYVQPSFIEQNYDFDYTFPEEICLAEGDRKTFVSTDTTRVSVDILTDRYPEIVLEKDGIIVATRQYSGKKREDFVNLPAGQYRIYLRKGGNISKPTVFEMVGTLPLSASIISNEIRVSIPNGYTPVCIVPVSSGNRPLLSTGKAKDGRYAFPLPEGIDHTSWGTTMTVRLAGKYSTFTYPTKIRYR